MRKTIMMVTAVALLVGLWAAAASAADLIPEGMVISEIYRRGVGRPVGSVALSQGEVVIIHQGDAVGYRAVKGRDLFQKDTVVCRDKGRALLQMADGSRLTLASRTSLKLNSSVYSEKKKDRSSFFAMARGKARFWITKLVNFTRTEVRVKTPTAVVGVRGSDFVVAATETTTEVTTLGDTELEVSNQFQPEQPPTILEDFQQTVVEGQAPPTPPVDIDPEQAADIVQDVPTQPLDDGTLGAPEGGGGTQGQQQGAGGGTKSGTTGQGATGGTDEGTDEGTGGTDEGTGGTTGGSEGQQAAAPAEPGLSEPEPEIVIDQGALIPPEEIPDTSPPPPEPDVIETGGDTQQDPISDIQQTQDNTSQEVREDIVIEALPDFPATPQY